MHTKLREIKQAKSCAKTVNHAYNFFPNCTARYVTKVMNFVQNNHINIDKSTSRRNITNTA